jgi:hypothetical protein
MYTLEYVINNNVGVICKNISEWCICKNIIINNNLGIEIDTNLYDNKNTFRVYKNGIIFSIYTNCNLGWISISNNSFGEYNGSHVIESFKFIEDVRDDIIIGILE